MRKIYSQLVKRVGGLETPELAAGICSEGSHVEGCTLKPMDAVLTTRGWHQYCKIHHDQVEFIPGMQD